MKFSRLAQYVEQLPDGPFKISDLETISGAFYRAMKEGTPGVGELFVACLSGGHGPMAEEATWWICCNGLRYGRWSIDDGGDGQYLPVAAACVETGRMDVLRALIAYGPPQSHCEIESDRAENTRFSYLDFLSRPFGGTYLEPKGDQSNAFWTSAVAMVNVDDASSIELLLQLVFELNPEHPHLEAYANESSTLGACIRKLRMQTHLAETTATGAPLSPSSRVSRRATSRV